MFRLTKRPTIQEINQLLQQQDITLHITKKRVKNINFRIKSHQLYISVPIGVNESYLAQTVHQRLSWVFGTHKMLMHKQATQSTPTLWGDVLDVDVWMLQRAWSKKAQEKFVQLSPEEQLLRIYQVELREWVAHIQAKWQQIVGKSANTIRFRNMRSRWGSCNTKTANITLNIQLAAYPKMCCEYVLVHELCHLHHANHSAQFWHAVQAAMPTYQHWHQLLKATRIDV